MQRRTADAIVGTAIALVLIVGLLGTWQAWQSSQETTSGTMNGMMTDGMMTSMNTGPSPIWLLFGTVAIAAIIAVVYIVVREGLLQQTPQPGGIPPETGGTVGGPSSERSGPENDVTTGDGGSHDTVPGAGSEPVGDASDADTVDDGESSEPSRGPARPAILDVLPEDERRVLQPVIESPGLTQIELRDRSDFSKSKVSQTVSELEKRGLLSRERQGRTYRVYPTDDVTDDR